MRKIYHLLFVAILLVACVNDQKFPLSEKKSVKSFSPAEKWEDVMLSGNGMEGMMVYGHPYNETIIFNSHKYLLPNGAPYDIPDMSDMVAPMQELMLKGEIGEGWKLYHLELLKRQGIDISKDTSPYAGMLWSQSFHPGYELHIRSLQAQEYNDYVRYTNYQTGEVISQWTDASGIWKRRSFASRENNLLYTYIKAPKGAKVEANISCETAFKTPDNVTTEVLADGNMINFRGKYPEQKGQLGGYEGCSRVIVSKGTVSAEGDSLLVRQADAMLVVTALDRHKDDFKQWEENKLQKQLSQFAGTYEEAFATHAKIQSDLYNRVEFSLDVAEADQAKASETLMEEEEADRKTINPALLEKLFYTSRYLYIASSGEHYAPRLSGMFVGAWGAAWAGDYTMDANANLAVLGGNILNMPECMEGYFQVVERSLPQWRQAAKQLYGCRGILGPVRIDGEYGIPLHVASYHAHTTATGLGPWILYPFYEHYKVTGDKVFLKERLYPLLLEQALFYEDFLTHKDDNGKYIFVPSNSPENAWSGVKPRCSAAINSTMDIAACKLAFEMLLKAEDDLGLKSKKQELWKQMLTDMPPYLVNEDGALQEWSWPGHGENYGHRHSSHMIAVWPAYDINPECDETKHFIPAIKVALQKRDAKIVHAHDALVKSIAQIRIKEGEAFYAKLKYLMEEGYFYKSLASSHDLDHHIYNYDLICSLQGMLAEMLVFTKEDMVELLPALPKQLSKGEINGVLGRNQITFNSIKWDFEEGFIHCTLMSQIDQEINLIYRKGFKNIKLSNGVEQELKFGDYARAISLRAGELIQISIEI